MLPTWASDLRGACLGLLLLVVLDACGVLELAVGGLRRWLLAAWAAVCIAGFVFSIAFYAHTSRTVFNRRTTWTFTAYCRHLMVTRPLEALWRFITFPLRVQPDFHVLGEVRTGTTSVAAHLRELGCIGPFSPWIIPLASDKESFYFVGHYWGCVHPEAYRMCFPLKLTMWLRRHVLGQAAPVFDACASHLNAPWAAPLMRRACPDAALVVLLRAPHDQHVSWWRLEQGAHAWGDAMGFGRDFLPCDYPPKTFREAQQLSRSDGVKVLYEEGERAGARYAAAEGALARLSAAWLPERLLPFPGGQLAAFAHMGRYVDNIRRYADAFGLDRMVIADFREVTRPGGADVVVERLAALAPALAELLGAARAGGDGDGAAARAGGASLAKLNASGELPAELVPEQQDVDELCGYYAEDNRRLFKLIGRDLGWNAPTKAVAKPGDPTPSLLEPGVPVQPLHEAVDEGKKEI